MHASIHVPHLAHVHPCVGIVTLLGFIWLALAVAMRLVPIILCCLATVIGTLSLSSGLLFLSVVWIVYSNYNGDYCVHHYRAIGLLIVRIVLIFVIVLFKLSPPCVCIIKTLYLSLSVFVSGVYVLYFHFHFCSNHQQILRATHFSSFKHSLSLSQDVISL